MKTNSKFAGLESNMLFQAAGDSGSGSKKKEHIWHKDWVKSVGTYGEMYGYVECLLCRDPDHWGYVIGYVDSYGYGYVDWDGDGYADNNKPGDNPGYGDNGYCGYDAYGDYGGYGDIYGDNYGGYGGYDLYGDYGDSKDKDTIGAIPGKDPVEWRSKSPKKDYTFIENWKPNQIRNDERSYGIMDNGCYLKTVDDKLRVEDEIMLDGVQMTDAYMRFVQDVCDKTEKNFDDEWAKRQSIGIYQEEANDFYQWIQQEQGVSESNLRSISLCETYNETYTKAKEGNDMGSHIRTWYDDEGEKHKHSYSIVGCENEGNGVILIDPQTGNKVMYRGEDEYYELQEEPYVDPTPGGETIKF